MRLSSAAFKPDEMIPQRYTGEGQDISPPLEWRDPPDGTRSFALICEDPDAPNGTFRHWAVYDIEPEREGLPEAFPPNGGADSIRQAVNDFGKHGYGGPLPPKGHGTHHYHFRLFALDTERLGLPHEASAADVETAVRSRKIAEARLTGLYAR